MRSFTPEEIEWAFGEWIRSYRIGDCFAWRHLTEDEIDVLTNHHHSRLVRELERQMSSPGRVKHWRNRISRIVDAIRHNW